MQDKYLTKSIKLEDLSSIATDEEPLKLNSEETSSVYGGTVIVFDPDTGEEIVASCSSSVPCPSGGDSAFLNRIKDWLMDKNR